MGVNECIVLSGMVVWLLFNSAKIDFLCDRGNHMISKTTSAW
jgi:hypothetical protein